MKTGVFVIFGLIFCISKAQAIDTVATGYRIVNSTTPRIDAAGKCRDVNNSSGQDVFVGTRTQGEWWSFLSFPPANVTPAICPLTMDYTTSAQKVLPSGANGVTVNESGTAWVSSGWSQITASTANAIVITGLVVDLPSSSNSEFEVDVGKGAAGFETVVATVSGVRRTNASGPWWLQIPIPVDNIGAGVRVAVRIRSDNASATAASIKLTYYDKPISGIVATTTLASQVLPSAAAGVSVTPSNTSWANSNWSQVIASTPTAIAIAALAVLSATNEEFEVDVGVGAAGFETVVTTFRDNITNGNGGPYITYHKPALDNIPAGSRVALRMRKNGTNTAAWRMKLTYYNSPTGLTLTALPLKWSPGAANGASVTPSGTVWASSAWTQLIASAPTDLQLSAFEFDPGTTAQFEFDFAVGASGQEVVIATFKGVCSNTGLQKYSIPFQPLLNAVPEGARLAVRIRTSSTNTTAWKVSAGYFEGAAVTNKASAYNKSLPSASNATLITPSGTSWGNSAWFQLSAPQTNPILITSIAFDPTTSEQFEFDIGAGAAGSEAVVTTLAGNVANTNGNQVLFLSTPLFVSAGTRIAIRMRKNGTSVTTWGIALNYVEIQ